MSRWQKKKKKIRKQNKTNKIQGKEKANQNKPLKLIKSRCGKTKHDVD